MTSTGKLWRSEFGSNRVMMRKGKERLARKVSPKPKRATPAKTGNFDLKAQTRATLGAKKITHW